MTTNLTTIIIVEVYEAINNVLKNPARSQDGKISVFVFAADLSL